MTPPIGRRCSPTSATCSRTSGGHCCARAAEFVDDIEHLQTVTATHGQGETEHANSEVEVGLTAALEAGTLAALEDISDALARTDDGSFGDCTACGLPIGVERLMAVPQARYCLACQQRHERRGR